MQIQHWIYLGLAGFGLISLLISLALSAAFITVLPSLVSRPIL